MIPLDLGLSAALWKAWNVFKRYRSREGVRERGREEGRDGGKGYGCMGGGGN